MAVPLMPNQRWSLAVVSDQLTDGRRFRILTVGDYCPRDSPTWQPPTEGAKEIVTEAIRDPACWLYRQLEAKYDHLISDAAIEEGAVVNEYTFTEAGW